MVESQQSTMVLPMTSTAVPTRRKERTSYQLQPETLHVNHSGILPAAALSNFFRAPSTPIQNKLPSINMGAVTPVTNSKSVHQRNKCLAEVIQSQLMELKLQHRCRYQRKESTVLAKLARQKSSLADVNGNSPSKSNSSANTITQRKSCSDLSKVLSADTRALAGTAWNSKQKSFASKTTDVSPNAKITLQMPKFNKIPFGERHNNSQKQSTYEKMETISSDKVLELTRSNTLVITAQEGATHGVWKQSSPPSPYMDAAKFESVYNWVKSVEAAHKQEGKCSEVLSIPTV